MSVLSDRWIKKMALEKEMIKPFVPEQTRGNNISYGLSSFGYDARVSNEFKNFTDVDSAIVDPKKVGLDVSALITLVSESSHHFEEVVQMANKTQEVVQCFTTTGSGSHILHVKTENSTSLEKLLRVIQSWPGVKRTETQLILNSYKKITPLTITEEEDAND